LARARVYVYLLGSEAHDETIARCGKRFDVPDRFKFDPAQSVVIPLLNPPITRRDVTRQIPGATLRRSRDLAPPEDMLARARNPKKRPGKLSDADASIRCDFPNVFAPFAGECRRARRGTPLAVTRRQGAGKSIVRFAAAGGWSFAAIAKQGICRRVA